VQLRHHPRAVLCCQLNFEFQPGCSGTRLPRHAEFARLKPLSSVPVQTVLVLGRLTRAESCTPTLRPGQCRTG
jgi:hypothetical protein